MERHRREVAGHLHRQRFLIDVTAAINGVITGVPGALDTLKRVAAELGDATFTAATIAAVPAKPYSPATMTGGDWDAAVGNHQPTTRTITTAADLPGNGVTPDTVIELNNVLWQRNPDTGPLQAIFYIDNSTIDHRIIVNRVGSYVQMRNCTVDVPLTNMGMYKGGPITNGGVLDTTSVSMYRVDVKTRIDGIWPGDGLSVGVGNPSIIDLCRFAGPGYAPYDGYPLSPTNIPATIKGAAGTTGALGTDAQFQGVKQLAISGGATYVAGDLVSTVNAALYQVSTGGSCSPVQLVNGQNFWNYWPGGSLGGAATRFKDLPSGDTTQPFATGPDTLQLVFVGFYLHCDGVQVIRTGHVDVRRTKISGFSNSCMLIQSAARSYDNGDNPTGPVRIVGCDLRAASYNGLAGQWIYVNTNQPDPNYTGANAGVYVGRWLRTAGVWSANSAPWLGRPEGVSITGTLFRNREGDNVSPQFSASRQPVYGGQRTLAANGSGSTAQAGDHPVYVRTEADRQAGITRQWSAPGVIDTAVLEARYQYGIFPGACDARSWIVWADNIDQTGAVIYPRLRYSVPGFDSQGYYTGI